MPLTSSSSGARDVYIVYNYLPGFSVCMLLCLWSSTELLRWFLTWHKSMAVLQMFSDLTLLFLRVPGGMFSAKDIQQRPVQEVVVGVLSGGQLKWSGHHLEKAMLCYLFRQSTLISLMTVCVAYVCVTYVCVDCSILRLPLAVYLIQYI